MSPGPGRIPAAVDPPFSRAATDGGRAVKARPGFVALREAVLAHIRAPAP